MRCADRIVCCLTKKVTMSDVDENVNINVSPRSAREVIGAGDCSTASTEASNMLDLHNVLEMIVVHNKRRDEALERVLDQINNRNSYKLCLI